jgi:hypothetical protein
MIKRICSAVIAAGFIIAAMPVSTIAQEKTQEKKLTTQQQKMKDCATKWKDEKARTNAKGREAYNKFMSGCLKN